MSRNPGKSRTHRDSTKKKLKITRSWIPGQARDDNREGVFHNGEVVFIFSTDYAKVKAEMLVIFYFVFIPPLYFINGGRDPA